MNTKHNLCLKSVAIVPLCLLAWPALADIDPLPQLPPVATYVQPAATEDFVICTGGSGGAYFKAASLIAGFVEAYTSQPESRVTLGDVSPVPGGGTYGCLTQLALGEADAAVIQSDGRAILAQMDSDLMGTLDFGGALLTEEILTFCSRKTNVEDFGGIGETSGATIMVAGGTVSGTNVMLNVIAGFDSDFASPTYIYAADLDEALDEVANDEADCAIAVMDINSPAVAAADVKYGDRVRLVGSWDANYRDLNYRDQQVYGWRAIPENTPGVQHFLDWDGDNGRGTWSPEVVTQSAVVVYREGMSDDLVQILKDAVAQVARLKDDVQD